MHKLALLGGEPVRRLLFPLHNTIGPEEKRAAMQVLESGNLSQFLGAWSEDFYGGPKVLEFETAWARYSQTKFGYSVNSNTSGLFAAVAGYIRPLYLQPIYQNRAGKCSFSCPRYEGNPSYSQGLCPVAERLHFSELFTLEFNRPGMSQSDL